MSKLIEWTKDSESYELIKAYRVNDQGEYEFITRQDDYYVTLLNRLYILLTEKIEDNNYDDVKDELIALAHGMEVYSLETTKDSFEYVNKELNLLYVAAIYYLCDLTTINTLLLKRTNIDIYESDSAKMLFFILSGGNCDMTDNPELELLKRYTLDGDRSKLEDLLDHIHRYYDLFNFKSLDDFFDTFILTHVISKYDKVNMWDDLKRYNNEVSWAQYVTHCCSQNVLSFLPSQRDSLKNGLLSFSNSFSLTMPTSAGKSYITELVIYQELQINPNAKILYLAPLRSLAYELKQRFKVVSSNLGFTFRSMYGGGSFSMEERNCLEADLLISTPEKFMSLEGAIDDFLNDFTLVICDEGQLLDSFHRGINYELLLTRLKKLANKRFLFISAIIPNIQDINTWLGGTEEHIGSSEYRPVDIKFAYSKQDGSNITLELYDKMYNNSILSYDQFINSEELCVRQGTQKRQSCAIALKSLNSGTVLLYTNDKNGSRGCGAFCDEIMYLIDNSRLTSPRTYSANQDKLCEFIEYLSYQFGDSSNIVNYANNGYIYHNADLPQDIREKIEYYYTANVIPLVVCTSTLAEGVNFPVKTLILAKIQNQDIENGRLLDRKTLKNIIGRVGRAGREKYGLVILPASRNRRDLIRVKDALKNIRIENIKGTLYNVVTVLDDDSIDLSEQDINEILDENDLSSAIDLMITRSGDDNLNAVNIDDVINNSLAYHLGNEATQSYLKRIFEIRHNLLRAEINEDKYPRFKATGLSVGQYKNLEDSLHNVAEIEIPSIYDNTPSEWSNFIIDIAYRLQNYTPCKIGTGKNKRDVDASLLSVILSCWLSGDWYHEIAIKSNTSVEDIIIVIGHIKTKLHMSTTSILRYISNFDMANDFLSIFPDYMYYGVNNLTKYNLIKTGLSDRIAVNLISDFLESQGYNNCESQQLNFGISLNLAELKQYISNSNIPVLSKITARTYIKENHSEILF